MINQDVLAYIRSQSALGVSRDAIKKALATGGWSEEDMVEAFAAIDGIQKPPPPPSASLPPVTPPITTPRPLTPVSAPVSAPATPPVTFTRPASSAAYVPQPMRKKRSKWPWVLLLLVLLMVGGLVAAYYLYPSLISHYIPGFPTPVEPLDEPAAQSQEPVIEENNTTINIDVPAASSTATTTPDTTASTTASTTAQ
jgi:hypothetical protein